MSFISTIYFYSNKEPPFGLSWDNSGPVRATMILAAVWFFIFPLSLVMFIPEKKTSIQKISLFKD